ncbi:carnitine O-acetyltransferase-like isoform X1 [Lytechinus variegatus]|uniref:carnitine O-acetyltransferase-like isoform X1 n=2 Tax=Lytechinus variegatus TaxID=7654 RepID=UPI001BB1A436|nr:carnitine O-acetyltransferase-like isoform X1 [Lytechinus variegatus]
MFSRLPKNLLQRVMGVTGKDGAHLPARLGPSNVHAGRMFAHQDSLARLPVPPLQQTLYKYLMAVKPIISPEDYEVTKKIVDDFGKPGGLGQDLQMGLINRAKKMENWLSDWWLKVAYLDYRSPVIVNVSPGVVFPEMSEFKGREGQLKQAATLINSVMDFKYLIDTQSVPVDKMAGQPLCMDQYYKILASCRIPGPKRDEVKIFPPTLSNAPKHIIIAYNNQFYSVDVLRPDGKPYSLNDIYAQLKYIVMATPVPAVPVGILTAEHRNTWGKIYKKMKKDHVNKDSFEKIKRSLFLVALDQDERPGEDASDIVMRGRQSLYGGGSMISSGNRWFDKTLQFWVGTSGCMGLTYEHCTAEGPPIVALADHSLSKMNNLVTDFGSDTSNPPKPERLDFNISPDIVEAIEEAKHSVDVAHTDLQVSLFQFKEFGKNFPKSQRLSPDSFIQNALQYTFFKLYGYSTATYESGSLRKYKFGRTDTIRSATIESDQFVRGMCDPSKTPSEKVMLLRNAIAAHKQYTNDVINGDGIDRHLLGLKLIAIENGANVPDIFMDTAFTSCTHFRLSTSQVPAKHDLTMLFGPVVPDGYGICYNPQEHHFNFSVTAFNTSPETDSDRFADVLQESLIEMCHILVTAPPAAKL